MSGTPGQGLPLIALLGRAHDSLEAAFDERLRASSFGDLSLAHSRNVLHHVNSQRCNKVKQLTDLSGVSKQALSLQIAHLEKAGYLVVSADPLDGRAKVLELTARGRQAQYFIGATMRDIDQGWRETWSEQGWDALRGQLSVVIWPTSEPM